MQRIDDDLLENINGGVLRIERNTCTLTYKGLNGFIQYEITDYEKAMRLMYDMQSQNVPEDEIISTLIAHGCLSKKMI